ncbi:MAG: hypothetical protein ACFFE4_00465 [Candidatus Thorarchaeota archaeon]
MGSIINVLEEIKARLDNAILAGNNLSDIKKVRLGANREVLKKDNDYPVIYIYLEEGEQVDIETTRRGAQRIELEIHLITNCKDNESNTLYDTSDSSGSIYLFEKLMNSIVRNTSGNVDLSFNNTVRDLMKYDWKLIEEGKLIIIKIHTTFTTKQYAMGSM